MEEAPLCSVSLWPFDAINLLRSNKVTDTEAKWVAKACQYKVYRGGHTFCLLLYLQSFGQRGILKKSKRQGYDRGKNKKGELERKGERKGEREREKFK